MIGWSARWEGVTCPWPRPTEAPEAAPLHLGMPAQEVLARRLAGLGLRGVRRVRPTDNRVVMVSLSPRGVLSIHRGFAGAPDRVLRAVVRFVAPGTPKAMRRAAEHEILAFRPQAHGTGTEARPRAPDRPAPGDVERTERLIGTFRSLNERHFGGLLPELPIRLSGRMRRRLGQLCVRHDTGEAYEITISRRHLERHGWTEAARTLLHEMVHLWQHASGHRVDHGRRFREKALEVGIQSSARRSVGRPAQQRRAARTD